MLVADRRAARIRVLAEQRTTYAVGVAIDEWRRDLLERIVTEASGLLGLTTLTAAPSGFDPTPAALEAAATSYEAWRRATQQIVLPSVAVAFGEAFRQSRAGAEFSTHRAQLDYLATVDDRLKIWPAGAFEELRPELLEALSEGETIEQIRDRVGAVLGIDTESRRIRADIGVVDKQLADDTLSPADRRTLRAHRRRLWEDHAKSLREWQWKARRIARTETQGAVEGGRLAAMQAQAAATGDRWFKRWRATDDLRVRASHRVADGQVVPINGQFRVGGFMLTHPADPITIAPHETINCVLGDTKVAWPLQYPLNATRRRYRGPIVHLRTADGHHLAVTPNHPVLTPGGYVPAGRLRPGDCVIAAPFGGQPDVDDVPSRIEEFYRAASKSGIEQRVVLRGMEFHGDAVIDDVVKVVRADRDLSGDVDTATTGHCFEHRLVGLARRLVRLCSARTSEGAPARVWSRLDKWALSGAATGGVSGTGEGAALVASESLHTQPVGLTPRADRQAQLVEPSDDDGAADAEVTRHLQDARAVGMKSTKIVQVKEYAGSHWVYNLSTTKRWYTANGIAVHNCRCSASYLTWDMLQDQLQGPNGSIGEIRPGGIRMGPDDPDDAFAVIQAVARDNEYPVDRRGEDYGQQPPTPAPDISSEVGDDRQQPLPDLSEVSTDDLIRFMDQANDDRNDRLYEWVEAEYLRREGADDPVWDNPVESDWEDEPADPQPDDVRAWLDAQTQWERDVTTWLDAEADWRDDVTDWLDAESDWLTDPLPGLQRKTITLDLTDPPQAWAEFRADLAAANPKYDTNDDYKRNCQRCVQALELRRRGYDVEAMPAPIGASKLSAPLTYADWLAFGKAQNFDHYGRLWRERDGAIREFVKVAGKTGADRMVRSWPVGARGWVRVAWKGGSNTAHVFSCETVLVGTKKVAQFYDPQVNGPDAHHYFANAKAESIYVMRVDDLHPIDDVRTMVTDH